MNRTFILTRMLVLSILIALPSCSFVSAETVISSKNAKSDPRLVGTWAHTEQNGKPPIRIEQTKDYALIIHFPDDRNPEKLIPIKAFAAKLGSSDYVNLAMEEKNGLIYQILLKYDFEDNKLNLYLFDVDTFLTKGLGTAESTIKKKDIEKLRTFLQSSEASKSFELMGSFVKTE